MRHFRIILAALLGLAAAAWTAQAEEAAGTAEEDVAPWNYAPCCQCAACEAPLTPPMFGDLLQAGFNFGFQGGFQGGFNFGFQGGFQGGFNVGLQFQGGFNLGAFPISVGRGAEKMAENESPRPRNRVYASYNYYHNVGKLFDVHREIVGFESTIWNGNGSIGLRLPYYQDVGSGFDGDDLGDLSFRFKYALINDSDLVVSTGIGVAAPTGPIPSTAVLHPNGRLERVHPCQLQPFLGYLWDRGDVFLHGFSSVQAPTDSRDVTVMYNDVGIGWRLFEGTGRVRAVIPTLEVHVNTPLNHRGSPDFPRFHDSVNLTGGSYFLLGENLLLGGAVGVPVTGPHLFDLEAAINLNGIY